MGFSHFSTDATVFYSNCIELSVCSLYESPTAPEQMTIARAGGERGGRERVRGCRRGGTHSNPHLQKPNFSRVSGSGPCADRPLALLPMARSLTLSGAETRDVSSVYKN